MLAVIAGLTCLATGAVAEGVTVTEDRRALFISIIEANDCRMHNFYPADGILEGIKANDFDRDEVRAIGRSLLETGIGKKNGDFLILKTENCG